MAIGERMRCDFAVFMLKGISIQRVFFNQDYWTTKLLPKLVSFYDNCVIPEPPTSTWTSNTKPEVPFRKGCWDTNAVTYIDVHHVITIEVTSESTSESTSASGSVSQSDSCLK